jgi:hypothetical protein
VFIKRRETPTPRRQNILVASFLVLDHNHSVPYGGFDHHSPACVASLVSRLFRLVAMMVRCAVSDDSSRTHLREQRGARVGALRGRARARARAAVREDERVALVVVAQHEPAELLDALARLSKPTRSRPPKPTEKR